jgi:hypothetical protein
VFWAGWLLCSVAYADVAADAAVAANEVVDVHCSQGWSGEGAGRSEALVAVSATLGRVDVAHEQTGVGYLRYWRGLIYQCLGQYEEAIADLSAFVEEHKGDAVYAEQVKVALVRLDRAGHRAESAGAGRAAAWVRGVDRVELSVAVGAGPSLDERACTEPVSPPTVTFQKCLGGPSESPEQGVVAVPLHASVRLRAFPHPSVGVAGWVQVRQAVQHQRSVDGRDRSLDPAPRSPRVEGGVGPAIRLSNRLGLGRAVGVRIEPGFAVALVGHTPQAGHYDYASPRDDAHQLDGGGWLGVHLGLALRIDLELELANTVALDLAVRGSLTAPASDALLAPIRPAESAVLLPLDPTEARQGTAGLRAAIQGLTAGAAPVAVGPFLDVGFDGRWIDFPRGAASTWGGTPCATEPDGVCGDSDWKVFSTQRLSLGFTAGIEIDFGGPPS